MVEFCSPGIMKSRLRKERHQMTVAENEKFGNSGSKGALINLAHLYALKMLKNHDFNDYTLSTPTPRTLLFKYLQNTLSYPSAHVFYQNNPILCARLSNTKHSALRLRLTRTPNPVTFASDSLWVNRRTSSRGAGAFRCTAFLIFISCYQEASDSLDYGYKLCFISFPHDISCREHLINKIPVVLARARIMHHAHFYYSHCSSFMLIVSLLSRLDSFYLIYFTRLFLSTCAPVLSRV